MKTPQNDRGRVKVRYMEIDVEGGSSAILEGLRTVTAAFGKDGVRTVNAAAQARVISQSAQPKPLAPKNGELFEPLAAPDSEAAEVEESMLAPEDEERVGAIKPRTRRSYPNCELIADLSVETGSPNLHDFAQTKKPEGNNEKYMVCASWLNKALNIKSLTANHFYTCFTALGWKVPKDAAQPLRNMKKKQFMQNASGEWELHSNGEQVVARLPQRN